MNTIRIKGESDVPTVILDRENNIFEMSGRSLPANSIMFFGPILEWLDDYAKNPLPRTEFVFRMTYYNTSSAKQILEILLRLEDIYKNGHDVRVTWFYESGNIDIEDAGAEYASIMDVPIIMTSYSPDAPMPQHDVVAAPSPKKNSTFVLTINRELGAGGKAVGRLLAEKLCINYFDYTVMEALSNKYDNDSDIIKNVSSNSKTWWSEIRNLIKTDDGKSQDGLMLTDKQSEILKSIAQNESCIVAGYGAFHIFKDYPNHINVFICASIENRVARLMSREGISQKEAMTAIGEASFERDMYVVEATGIPRHDTRNYDLVINMDNISEEDAAELIAMYVKQRKKYFAILVDKD